MICNIQIINHNINLMCIRFFIILLSITLFTSCDELNSTDIPFSSKINIQIDGLFNKEDWSNSKVIELTSNNSLYLIQDKDNLFLGIQNKENVARYIDLYIDNESIGTINLHASMQLGERQLIDEWSDTIPEWNWGNNTNWTANKVEVVSEDEKIPFIESLKSYDGHEFQISKKKINNKKVKIRLEIKDFVGQADDIIFPINSERKRTDNWFMIELK